MTDGDILDIIAIAESTPGPIAINAATFMGYKTAGFGVGMLHHWGGAALLPHDCGHLPGAAGLERNRVVQYAFAGIRAGVLALICKALVSMYRQCPRNLFSYLLAGAAFWPRRCSG